MIRYHGGPVWPERVAIALWPGRHAMISYWHRQQINLAAELAQSFVIDNGAYSAWRASESGDDVVKLGQWTWEGYCEFVQEWHQHPGFDWAVIPDVIEGTEEENDEAIGRWRFLKEISVPVYHMHESLNRLDRLVSEFPRVAIGSSGEYSSLQSDKWWRRMNEIMAVACDNQGRPRTKLHGMRMMSPTVFSHVPFASVDSTQVAINHGLSGKFTGAYAPLSNEQRALVLADRCERHASASRWSGSKGVQMNLELVG